MDSIVAVTNHKKTAAQAHGWTLQYLEMNDLHLICMTGKPILVCVKPAKSLPALTFRRVRHQYRSPYWW